MLTTTMMFLVLPTADDKYFKSIELREDLKESYTALTRSPYQWVFIVFMFKINLELTSGTTLGAAKVSEAYSRAKLASDSEALSKEYIDRALTVYTNLLSVPAIRKAVDIDLFQVLRNAKIITKKAATSLRLRAPASATPSNKPSSCI